jgi:hypothetical protein
MEDCMKIKLLVARAGAGFSQNRGEEIEVGDAEALRMIAADQAVAVEVPPVAPIDPKAAKAAVAAAVEKAIPVGKPETAAQ